MAVGSVDGDIAVALHGEMAVALCGEMAVALYGDIVVGSGLRRPSPRHARAAI
jgi:hypothetical protein